MCHLETSWDLNLDEAIKSKIIDRLKEIEADDLITLTPDKVKVKEEGRMFLRNICMAFDLKLLENEPETRVFSMTI